MLASLDFAALSSLGLGWGAALLVGFAYLLGSVPFGLLIGRWRGVDLRTVGSGNIGATNAARAMGRGFGLVVYLLDVGKGLVPVLLAGQVAAGEQALAAVQGLCGLAAVLGHCFPLWLRFQGGKGVATACAAVVGVDPWSFVAGGLVWLLTRTVSGYVGLASMLMCVAFPIAWSWRHAREAAAPAGLVLAWSLIAVLVIARHRANIARMLAGTEPRTGKANRT
jgi:glycerol-3-phosphate acyltransferase PlsY